MSIESEATRITPSIKKSSIKGKLNDKDYDHHNSNTHVEFHENNTPKVEKENDDSNDNDNNNDYASETNFNSKMRAANSKLSMIDERDNGERVIPTQHASTTEFNTLVQHKSTTEKFEMEDKYHYPRPVIKRPTVKKVTSKNLTTSEDKDKEKEKEKEKEKVEASNVDWDHFFFKRGGVNVKDNENTLPTICGRNVPKISNCAALACLVINIFFPGLGTMICGCIPHEGRESENFTGDCCCYFWLGVVHFLLWPLLIGWILSILFGCNLLTVSNMELQPEPTPDKGQAAGIE